MKNLHIPKLNSVIVSALLGYVGAWLFVHMHLDPEAMQIHEPLFHQILNGTGPAPDQYRLLQNHLIGFVFRFLDLYRSVMLFTALSLAGCIYLLLECVFIGIERKHRVLLAFVLGLIYPVLMYNGPRGDSAFILLLSLLLTHFLNTKNRMFFILCLVALSFTRADLTLFAVVFSYFYERKCFDFKYWIALVALPILVQSVLKYAVFPEATYYVQVLMIEENLKLSTVFKTPALLFLIALGFVFNEKIYSFLYWLWNRCEHGRLLGLSIVLYCGAICTVAIFCEVRLFLPLLTFVLLLVERFTNRAM